MFDDDGRDEILESPITLCCEGDVLGCQYSLGLLSMSRSTRNCWDAMLPWPSTSLASSAGSSTSTLPRQQCPFLRRWFSRSWMRWRLISGRKSGGSTSCGQHFGWITAHNRILYCVGCWGCSEDLSSRSSPFGENSTFIMPLEQQSTNFIPNPLLVLHRPFCHGPQFCPGSRKTRGPDRP